MSLAFTNLSVTTALILLIAVVSLILWGRVRRWNDRQQQWRESETATLAAFEASRRGRAAGRRATDLPDIQIPAVR